MPVTATEVSRPVPPPAQDTFDVAPQQIRNSLRFRIWPNAEVGLTLVGKKQGAGWQPQREELTFAEQPAVTCGPTTG